jgi:hypothetical protein
MSADDLFLTYFKIGKEQNRLGYLERCQQIVSKMSKLWFCTREIVSSNLPITKFLWFLK